jgi:hypothetical protein
VNADDIEPVTPVDMFITLGYLLLLLTALDFRPGPKIETPIFVGTP